ncbi:MAG: thioredoxin family protein [bacterium]
MMVATLNDIIQNAIKNSISYDAYVDLVNTLVENEDTSGEVKSDALVNYTMLNQRRLKRWNKTVKVSEEASKAVKNINKSLLILVITESWCGDAAHVMPAVQKLIEHNDQIEMRVVFRDENPDLMDQFLTNGSRSIAKFIILDSDTLEVVNTYGPRPSEATKLVNEYKETHGKLTPEFKEDLQRWYNKDKGQNTIADMLNILQ